MNLSEYVGIEYDADGMDCWHLVRRVLSEKFSIDIPRLDYGDPLNAGNLYSHFERDYERFSSEWVSVAKPQFGDLLLFLSSGVATHAGLMLDGGRFLHSQESTGSVVEPLNEYWRARLHAIYRHQSKCICPQESSR